MEVKCPKCSQELHVSLKESLAPYSMTVKVYPNDKRMVGAKALVGMLDALIDALVTAGDVVGHKTFVHILDTAVGEDMSISVTVAATPVLPEQRESAA